MESRIRQIEDEAIVAIPVLIDTCFTCRQICQNRRNRRFVAGGLLVLLVAVGGIVAGLVVKPPPTPSPTLSWRLTGDVLTGEESEFFGSSVDITQDGKAVAVSGSGDEHTFAEVYALNDAGTSWMLIGDRIRGPTLNQTKQRPPDSVFLSDDRKTLLLFSGKYVENTKEVGLVQIFKFDGSKWVFNQARAGTNATFSYGSSSPRRIWKVYMSSNGKQMTIIASGTDNKGYSIVGATVFNINDESSHWDSSTLVDKWEDVSVSRDADVIVLGASGHTMIYRFGGSGWIFPGKRLSGGNYSTSYFGRSGIVLSDDGATVAISDIESYSWAGSVTVYRYNEEEDSWLPRGRVLHPEFNSGEWFEGTVLMSGDGNSLGVLSKFGDSEFPSKGKLQLFRYKDHGWDEVDSVESSPNSQAVLRCALSDDGHNLCCSEPYLAAGKVSIYHLERE